VPVVLPVPARPVRAAPGNHDDAASLWS
jgi:hypothetical protein